MILGCDAAGLDEDGNEVIVHSVISSDSWRGDETLDPRRPLLSEKHPGTLAERVAVPRRNLVPKPPELTFAEAACLPTAWLTAYRMLFTRGSVVPGMTVLVQGAAGGVATALVVLASAAGHASGSRAAPRRSARMRCHSAPRRVRVRRATARAGRRRDGDGRQGDVGALDPLAQARRHARRLGATTGDAHSGQLSRVFFLQLSVIGSTMGTRDELERLVRFCVEKGVRPQIDKTVPLSDARDGLRGDAHRRRRRQDRLHRLSDRPAGPTGWPWGVWVIYSAGSATPVRTSEVRSAVPIRYSAATVSSLVASHPDVQPFLNERPQRAKLLEAMVRAVAEKGYEAATVADAVKLARVSRGTFYELFESKEACLAAAYRAGNEVLEERVSRRPAAPPIGARSSGSGSAPICRRLTRSRCLPGSISRVAVGRPRTRPGAASVCPALRQELRSFGGAGAAG